VDIVAIVQARLGSTRLPGKVLEDLAGEPMLARVVERAGRSESLSSVVVATTDRPEDDRLAELCSARGWRCHRGSAEDVLARYVGAAAASGADVVVRLTSDCPFVDPEVIDRVVGAFLSARPAVDYAANVLPPRSWPRGLDTEVFTAAALARADHEDADPASREHVTPYLYRHPERFRLLPVPCETDLSAQRWTVDTPEDLAFARRLYEHLDEGFGWRDVLALLDEHADWAELNRHVRQKEIDPAAGAERDGR
jgi:spore coat polysaccharide biosynthesis protein SpsF